jgi:hypothetical protein
MPVPFPRGFRLVRRLWLVPVAVLILTGAGTTLRFPTEGGTLVVEVDDPAVKVTLDGQELKIAGAGPNVVRLRTGPHLFRAEQDGKPARDEILTVTKDDRTVVRVRASAGDGPAKASRPSSELIADARQKASELVGMRDDIDRRLWSVYKTNWVYAEAAKLSLRFNRGDGQLVDAQGVAPGVAEDLKADLIKLRDARSKIFDLLTEAAQTDRAKPASPLVGAWKIVEVGGAGGLAADALDLFDPDPIGKRFVVANGVGALHTASVLWLVDITYPDDAPEAIDLELVVRGNSTARGRYQVDKNGNEASLRLNPYNFPRPATATGDPTDGGVVLRLRRIGN